MAALTFAHEVGHSLGASHDPAHCEDDTEAGQYLMFRYKESTSCAGQGLYYRASSQRNGEKRSNGGVSVVKGMGRGGAVEGCQWSK